MGINFDATEGSAVVFRVSRNRAGNMGQPLSFDDTESEENAAENRGGYGSAIDGTVDG